MMTLEIRYSLSAGAFDPQGYQVSEAASGEQGVALVKKGPAPDLVFLDVRIGRDGRDRGPPAHPLGQSPAVRWWS